MRPAVETVVRTARSTSSVRASLFAEAADDEQRIVDRETEPEDRRDVDREGRDVGDGRQHPQEAEGSEDGHHPDGHGEQRGHEAAEDHQQQEHQHGHREHLGPDDVGLGEVLHLGHDDDGATYLGGPAVRRPEGVLDAVDLRLACLLGGAGQRDHGEGAVPVAAEQAGRDVGREAVRPRREH